MSDLADAESGVRGSASLPRHSVRVLNPFNDKQTITDLIALGVSRREAELNVRRGSGRTLRFDGVPPVLAQGIVAEFGRVGGVANAGPSAYRGHGAPDDALDLILLGTVIQFEMLAGALAATGGGLEGAVHLALASTTWGAGVLRMGPHAIDLGRRVGVMGILNVTPDSFFDGGRYFDPDRAVERGLAMVQEGADIIDVGGDSANGEAAAIDAAEEIRRVGPVVKALARQVAVPIAVDTHRAETAAAVLDLGATLINDITGLSDPEMASVIGRGDAGVCVMHILGVPKSFPAKWHYRTVLGDIIRFLETRTDLAISAGVRRDRICIDPGIEFGKLIGQDLDIFRRIPELHVLGFPILIAASRKTMIGNVLGLASKERLEGTAAVNAFSIARGAHIIRVHDVQSMVRIARMSEALVGLTIDGTPMERCRSDGKIVDVEETLG